MLYEITRFVVLTLIVTSVSAENAPVSKAANQAAEALNSAQENLSDNLSTTVKKKLSQAEEILAISPELANSREALDSTDKRRFSTRIGTLGTTSIEADIDQLLQKFKAINPNAAANKQHSAMLIFVSESIPLPTMKQLVDQAEQAQIPLVFRGFVGGSMRKTLIYIRDLLGIELSAKGVAANPIGRNVEFMIDPVLFVKFNIDRVPAFSVIRSGSLCRGPSASCGKHVPEHYSVFGDVSLSYAVQSLERLAPAFSQELAPVSKVLSYRF